MPSGCFALAVIIIFLVFLPFFMANVALTALARLGLSPGMSLFILLAVLMGSMVNIPVKRVEHGQTIEARPGPMFGFSRIFPHFVKRRNFTIIAVNVGGCLIPLALTIYQLVRLLGHGAPALALTAVAVALNVFVCYHISKPLPGVGIAMPALVPGLTAALSAIVLMPGFAPPLAFTAGVLGPLLGADLLHLKDIGRSPTGMASIGGAGTFDGIVISGLIAVLLA